MNTDDLIRCQSKDKCYVCGSEGSILYPSMNDRLFGSQGNWNLKKCTNVSCDLIWLDPVPTEEDIHKAYKNYFTHTNEYPSYKSWSRRLFRTIKADYLNYKYGCKNNATNILRVLAGQIAHLFPVLRADMDYIVDALPFKNNGKLLEIGCGGGTLLKTLKDIGWEVEGVEKDSAAVANARSKGLRVHLGDLITQRYPDNHFDAVIMVHVIEHIYEPSPLLKECCRILKDDGHLIITTPNSKSWGHRKYKNAWLHLDPPRHIHIFDPKSLMTLMKREGFNHMILSSSIRGAHSIFFASRSICRNGLYQFDVKQPMLVLWWARVMQHLEWLATRFSSDLAEEITIIAKK